MSNNFKKNIMLFSLFLGIPFFLYSQDADEKADKKKEEGKTAEKVKEENKDAQDVAPTQESVAQKRLSNLSKKVRVRHAENIKKAEVHFDQGMLFYNKNMYTEAVHEFQKVRRLNPNHKKVNKYLKESLNQGGKHLDIVEAESTSLRNREDVKQQEKLIEIKNSIEKGQEYQAQSLKLSKKVKENEEADNLDRRRKLLDLAKEEYNHTLEILQWADIGKNRKNEFKKTVLVNRRKIKIERMKISEQLEEIKKRDAMRRERRKIEDDRLFHKNRIKTLLVDAKEAYKRGDYVQCEKVCRRVLRIDPGNKSAYRLRKNAHRKRLKSIGKQVGKNLEEEQKRWVENTDIEQIPWADPVVYSEDWEWISGRSAIKGTDRKISAWERKYQAVLDRPGTFEWDQTPLAEVIDEIKENFPEITFSFQKRALDNLGITDQDPVDLKVKDLPLRFILNLLLTQFGLTYGLVDEVLVISDEKGVQGELSLVRYDVRDLTIAIRDFPGPNVTLNNSTGVGGGDDQAPLDFGGGDEDVEGVTADDIAELIKSKLLPKSWDEERGTSIVVNNGQLLVMQTYEMHELIEEFLTRLRRSRATQVVVSTRFINIKDNFFESIGVEWRGLAQATLNDTTAAHSADGAGFLSDIRELDNYDVRAGIFTGTPPGGVAGTTGLFGQIAVLGNTQFEAVLAALESNQEIKTLQAPRISVFNNQLAHIAIITQTAYISDFDIVDGGFDPVISTFFEGVVLEVRPTISSNRRYITLQLSPTLRELKSFSSITIQEGTFFGISQEAQIPEIQTSAVQTTVALPDRGVMVIGGMTNISKAKQMSGIPILSKIPLIGRLFRRDTEKIDQDNLLILVHAEIILMEEIESNL